MKISESRYRCNICGSDNLRGDEVKFLENPLSRDETMHICWNCVNRLLAEKLEQDWMEELFADN